MQDFVSRTRLIRNHGQAALATSDSRRKPFQIRFSAHSSCRSWMRIVTLNARSNTARGFSCLFSRNSSISISDGGCRPLFVLPAALSYLLLLSVSEFIGFSWAYLIAAVASTGLITHGIAAFFLGGGVRTLMIGAGLTGVYLFLYITLRQQDHALLMGAIAPFILLAIRTVRDAQGRLVCARR